MFAHDLFVAYGKRIDELIRSHEAVCGKGIKETDAYWSRVGEIRGLKRAKEVLRETISRNRTEEDNE